MAVTGPHRAGWPSSDIIGFYQKLAATDSATYLSWSYPSAASRLDMARTLALLFRN
jgi:hypothetical protein